MLSYHNDGSISIFTSLILSIISNIISSVITSIISTLTNFMEIYEAIILSVKDKKKFVENIIRFLKYIKMRLFFFHLSQISLIIFMAYYLFIFCTVYQSSQGSIIINYIIGALTSLGFSAGLSIVITSFRLISLKYHYKQLFNISKYLYNKF